MTSLPSRFVRLGQHLIIPFQLTKDEANLIWLQPQEMGIKMGIWFIELFFYTLDLFGIGEVYGILADWFSFRSRKLYDWEIELSKSVYGDSIPYQLITVDENALWGLKWPKLAKAYVSYQTINTSNTMANGLLLHEMVHIWQYHKFGSNYLLHALRAQYSELQYNYGGAIALRLAIQREKDLLSFNFEQQGDLVQDYYRIKNGYRPFWGQGKIEDLQYYEHFIQQLKA